MRSSVIPDRSTSHLRSIFPLESTTEHFHGSSTVNRVYPQLENLESSSSRDVPALGASSRVDNLTATSAYCSADQYQRNEYVRHSSPTPPSSPRHHVAAGPSVISQQVLPTYRQVSMSSEGSHPSGQPSSGSESPPYQLESSLPDILHSHIVPHIPPARPNQHRQHRNRNRRSEEEGAVRGNRHRPRTFGEGSGRTRRSSRTQSTSSPAEESSCKEPCVKCVVTVTSFRWVLVVLSVLGVSCVVAGIVLAALHPAVGTSLLYLSVMFIGLGVLLVVVVGVGWKCTPRGHEPLHALFGIGSFRHRGTREGRHGRYRNRDRNWFGGMLYPEFQYPRPPPTYAVSMQDYQNQTSQEQDDSSGARNTTQSDGDSLPSSPPPSYRSRASTAHSGIHIAFPHSVDGDHPSSRPPTYRSRAPSRRPSLSYETEVAESVLESEVEARTVRDVSFLGSSNVHRFPDGSQTSRVMTSSASASFSHLPSSHTAAIEVPSDSHTSFKQLKSITSQVHTVPLRRSSQNYIQDSSIPTHNIQNVISDPSSSASSRHHEQIFPAGNQNGQRGPGFHQRMASEDRHILEQTLQSLEEHMNESAGIMNQGANFDEQDQNMGPVNTHL